MIQNNTKEETRKKNPKQMVWWNILQNIQHTSMRVYKQKKTRAHEKNRPP